MVEGTRLVCDTSSCRVRSSSRRFVQRANQPRCLTRRPSSQPPNFEERDIEPGRGDRKVWKFSERGRLKSAKVQLGSRGGRRWAFYMLPLSAQLHLSPWTMSTHSLPLHCNHPDTFRLRLDLAHNQERGEGPRRPRPKIPGRNSYRRAEPLVDWARLTSFPTRSGVREVQETNRRAGTEEEMQPKLGDWGDWQNWRLQEGGGAIPSASGGPMALVQVRPPLPSHPRLLIMDQLGWKV